jgi:hypothetical protein
MMFDGVEHQITHSRSNNYYRKSATVRILKGKTHLSVNKTKKDIHLAVVVLVLLVSLLLLLELIMVMIMTMTEGCPHNGGAKNKRHG